MAGEKIKVLAGKPVKIRVTAAADAAEGDYVTSGRRQQNNQDYGGVAGFWLHDVKKDEVGDVCVYCEVAEMPNNNRAHVAGQVLVANTDNIDYATERADIRNNTYNAVIVYENTPRSATRLKVIWGLH